MTMTRVSMRLSVSLLLFAVVCAFYPASTAHAQSDDIFSFGPPLRPGIIFAYKYTERTRATQEMLGQLVDSSDRTLTYFITQRMLSGENGTRIIEANIDSMRIDFDGTGGHINFNTQHLQGNESLVRHPEVLAVSSLVNRMVKFTLSPYGEVVGFESPALQGLLEQSKDPAIDAFTRERIHAVVANGYLASIYFPWRGVLPLGQKVTYGDTMSVPFWTSMDLVSFRDTAHVTLQHASNGNPGPIVRYFATLSNPANSKLTSTAISDPMTISSANATVNGELRLDEDGSVLSGWSSLKGSVASKLDGKTITSNMTQEVFVDLMSLMPF